MLKLKRPGEQQHIEIQARDITLLRELFESRVMTLAQIAALHFDRKSEAAKKRVQKLKTAGLIAERPRRAYEPSVLFLTSSGFELLRSQDVLVKYPELSRAAFERRAQVKELTLRHELAVMNVKVAIVSAVQQTAGLTISEFSTWPLLYEFRAERSTGREVTVKPDAFLRMREDCAEGAFEHAFFVEVDRSTETQEILALKAHCYRDYYRRGGLAVKNGRPRSEYEAFPFRVLMVFRNPERRNNTAERLLQCNPPILTQAWLTTSPEINRDPIGPIWVRPIDYRNAIGGMWDRPGMVGAYRRQRERQAHIEAHVIKHSLLKDDEPQVARADTLNYPV